VNGIQETLSNMDARIDRRFEAVDRRFEAVEGRLNTLDQKIDRRFDALDEKMSRQFVWMIGIQVTTLLTVLGAVITAVLTR
jgi:hypothetical protein